jgi:hypothetical protein
MALLDNCAPEWREALMAELMQEAADMSSRELAFLLLDAMDDDEMQERIGELAQDSPESANTHH